MKQKARDFFQAKLMRIGEADGTLKDRLFERPDVTQDIQDGKIHKVHISGVCGTAMSSLAGLFAHSGFEVSGSDTGCYPPVSDLIDSLGIKYHDGFSEDNVKGKDLVIIPNIFGPGNPEATFMRNSHLPELSLPEAVSEFFIKDRTSIVIAGTHGKTTTTGMAAHVFLKAGKNPGFLVGGVAVKTDGGIQETSFGAPVSDTKHFVIEGDEYDTAYFDKSPKFMHYRPTIAVITSLEFDHADIYKDFGEYNQSFIFLAEEMPKDGLLVLNGDSAEVRSLAAHSEAVVLYYGFGPDSDVTAKDIQVDAEGQHFTLVYKGQDLGRFDIRLFGQYNLANALSVCAIALHEKLSTDELRIGLSTYLGMKRRQEIRGVIRGVTVIDDFAHHPTAVRETLSGIRELFPSNRIVALFEPRSNTSRRKMFEHDYGKSFGSVDALYLSMPPLRHNDTAADFIDGNVVVADALALKKAEDKAFEAFCVQNGDEALEKLVPSLKEGDVVVVMSNGSFDGVHEKLLAKLGA